MSMSKRERKQYRKELFRKVERRRALVRRGILVFALISLVGLVASGTIALTKIDFPAVWVAGPTGGVILAAAGFIAAGGIMLRRQKGRMGFLGWAGVVLAVAAGLQLITALTFFLVGQTEASDLTGLLSLVPVLFSIKFFGAEWLKDVRGGNDNSVADTFATISKISN